MPHMLTGDGRLGQHPKAPLLLNSLLVPSLLLLLLAEWPRAPASVQRPAQAWLAIAPSSAVHSTHPTAHWNQKHKHLYPHREADSMTFPFPAYPLS